MAQVHTLRVSVAPASDAWNPEQPYFKGCKRVAFGAYWKNVNLPETEVRDSETVLCAASATLLLRRDLISFQLEGLGG